MINRRHIRMKVMQSLYAMTHADDFDIVKEEKFLRFSIQRLFDLYVLNLQLLLEVNQLAKKKMEIAKKKMLATQEDLSPNTKFINNIVLEKLKQSPSLSEYIEQKKLNYWSEDDEYVKMLFEALMTSKEYKTFMADKDSSFQLDKHFILDFFKDIIAPDSKLADYFEDKALTWVDDIPFVNTWVVRSIERMSEKKVFKIGRLYKDEDDEKFVSELFRKTVLNFKEFDQEIIERTPNWESDRIANMDMILIKMAIAEFLHFPSIPVRVTINEYIELAKDYSTQKSGYFINGVLDRISRDFSADKRIQKSGRGLV